MKLINIAIIFTSGCGVATAFTLSPTTSKIRRTIPTKRTKKVQLFYLKEDQDQEQEQEQQVQLQQQQIDIVDAVFQGRSRSKKIDNVATDKSTLITDRINTLLNTPFFDPNNYNDDDDTVVGKLATFVKANPEVFKTIFIGIYFNILVMIAQDLLRIQMYNTYTASIITNGQLF